MSLPITKSSWFRVGILLLAWAGGGVGLVWAGDLKIGMGEVNITPPVGYPMAGYYHERLATGTKDPLKAKALYLAENGTEVIMISCDLTGVSIDLVTKVREKGSKASGIKKGNIFLSATHSHTAPDYTKELWIHLGTKEDQGKYYGPDRPRYIEAAIDRIVELIKETKAKAVLGNLATATVAQKEPVSFNRRFVMRDGSIKTWQNFKNPEVLRSAGPIDPDLQVVTATAAEGNKPMGAYSSFALHLDTVGGLEWSADYPFFLEESLRQVMGPQAVSVFGLGCCGDINHVDSAGGPVNKTPKIGHSLGATLTRALSETRPIKESRLQVLSEEIHLPIGATAPVDVLRAKDILTGIQKGAKVDFLEQVDAYRTIVLDQLHHAKPYADSGKVIGWGLTRHWRGIGDSLPIEVKVVTVSPELAFVFLPGEVFVDLGLQIKRASPFATTVVVELSNCVETAYIPTRAAYAQGSYEVTNSMLKPGGGERLVETSLTLLRKAAVEMRGKIPVRKE